MSLDYLKISTFFLNSHIGTDILAPKRFVMSTMSWWQRCSNCDDISFRSIQRLCWIVKSKEGGGIPSFGVKDKHVTVIIRGYQDCVSNGPKTMPIDRS